MENRVSQMSVGELRELISEVVEEKLAKYADPDYGLEFREEFVERIRQQSKDYREGKLHTVSLDELLADLGIDKSEIEAEENVPAQVF